MSDLQPDRQQINRRLATSRTIGFYLDHVWRLINDCWGDVLTDDRWQVTFNQTIGNLDTADGLFSLEWWVLPIQTTCNLHPPDDGQPLEKQ